MILEILCIIILYFFDGQQTLEFLGDGEIRYIVSEI